jgi:hypothetical protein
MSLLRHSDFAVLQSPTHRSLMGVPAVVVAAAKSLQRGADTRHAKYELGCPNDVFILPSWAALMP